MSENLPQIREITDLPALPEADAIAAALAKRINAPTGDKIRVTQFKKFRLPNGQETEGPLQGVIVDFVSQNSYYPDGFDKDELVPPTCFAINAEPSLLAPSSNSPEKQAETCASCPHNQWGTGPRGKGRACKNSRVLAVMPVDAGEDTPIWVLQVSPTAIKPFDDYVRSLVTKKIAPIQLVTEIGFDPEVDYPSLRFRAVRPLAANEFPTFMAQVPAAQSRLLTEPDTSKQAPAAGAPPAKRGFSRAAR